MLLRAKLWAKRTNNISLLLSSSSGSNLVVVVAVVEVFGRRTWKRARLDVAHKDNLRGRRCRILRHILAAVVVGGGRLVGRKAEGVGAVVRCDT